MFLAYNFMLVLISFIFHLISVESRCGQPEIPFQASINKADKQIFEEGETVKVSCLEGILIGENLDEDEEGILRCTSNKWDKTNLRCSRLFNLTKIDLFSIDENQTKINNLSEQEINKLNDNDPMTCLPVKFDSKLLLDLKVSILITHISMMIHFDGEKDLNSTLSLEVYAGDERCVRNTEYDIPKTMSPFLVFKCSHEKPIQNITIDLHSNSKDVNVCGVDIFSIEDQGCGQPERPIFSSITGRSKGQGDQSIQYSCRKGYTLKGNSIRRCSFERWMPQTVPTCIPIFKCNLITNLNFSFIYFNIDQLGYALPGITKALYTCSNDTEEISRLVWRTCLYNGEWTDVARDKMPWCVPKDFDSEFVNVKNPNFFYYGCSAIGFLILISIVILFQMRRVAKRISRQMRETTYQLTDKAKPTYYNSDSSYSDVNTYNTDNLMLDESPVQDQKF